MFVSQTLFSLSEIRGRAAFFFRSREGAAETFIFYFLRQNRGAAALQKGGAAETFIFYFGDRNRGAGTLRKGRGMFYHHFMSI